MSYAKLILMPECEEEVAVWAGKHKELIWYTEAGESKAN